LKSVPFVEEHSGEPLSVHNTVRRYHDSLIHFLRQRLRTPEDANDVAQEAYIRMMQYQNSRAIRSPSSMLFRIAINVANDLGRSEQVRHAQDRCNVDDLELASDSPSPEREISARQELELLRAAIDEAHDLSADRRPLRDLREDGGEAHQPGIGNLHEEGRGRPRANVIGRNGRPFEKSIVARRRRGTVVRALACAGLHRA
jgi:RNA polymerase sigma factor (sigma-70 family)